MPLNYSNATELFHWIYPYGYIHTIYGFPGIPWVGYLGWDTLGGPMGPWDRWDLGPQGPWASRTLGLKDPRLLGLNRIRKTEIPYSGPDPGPAKKFLFPCFSIFPSPARLPGPGAGLPEPGLAKKSGKKIQNIVVRIFYIMIVFR